MEGRVGDSHAYWGECLFVIGVERAMCAKGLEAGGVTFVVVSAGGCAWVRRRGPCATDIHVGARSRDRNGFDFLVSTSCAICIGLQA